MWFDIAPRPREGAPPRTLDEQCATALHIDDANTYRMIDVCYNQFTLCFKMMMNDFVQAISSTKRVSEKADALLT